MLWANTLDARSAASWCEVLVSISLPSMRLLRVTSARRSSRLRFTTPPSARCGIGNQHGEGNQIRLLLDDAGQAHRNGSQIALLDQSVRWVLGDCSQNVGSRRFLFFSCKQAQDAAMGGRIC